MKPWVHLAKATAPDGELLELRRRDQEFLILAGGHDLMSSKDEASSRALADLGCGALDSTKRAKVLVGGLGMGYTARAALDACGAGAHVDVAELVPEIAEWNETHLGSLADFPLRDKRLRLHVRPVQELIKKSKRSYSAILLDVDNGPDSLAHKGNSALYTQNGITLAWNALSPGGVLAVWSFSDDPGFTKRLKKCGFQVECHKTDGSRSGRGRFHYVWVAKRIG